MICWPMRRRFLLLLRSLRSRRAGLIDVVCDAKVFDALFELGDLLLFLVPPALLRRGNDLLVRVRHVPQVLSPRRRLQRQGHDMFRLSGTSGRGLDRIVELLAQPRQPGFVSPLADNGEIRLIVRIHTTVAVKIGRAHV